MHVIDEEEEETDSSEDTNDCNAHSFSTASQSTAPKYTHAMYSEPGLKDGSQLFGMLRSEVAKAIPIKSTAQPEIYLDKITFVARKMVSLWFGQEISLEHFNMCIDVFHDKNYLISFPLMLESFRKFQYFQIHQAGFKTLCELVMVCLTEVS